MKVLKFKSNVEQPLKSGAVNFSHVEFISGSDEKTYIHFVSGKVMEVSEPVSVIHREMRRSQSFWRFLWPF